MAWGLNRTKYEINRMLTAARETRMANMLLTKLMGPSGIGMGTSTGYFKLGAMDVLLDGVPYSFPGSDDVSLPAAGANTTATQYRKVLISLSASACKDKDPNRVLGGDFVIAAQADAALLGAGHIMYTIHGEVYYCLLDTSITLTGTDVLDTTKWRAYRIEIDRKGTVTAISDGDSQHAEEDTALIGLGTITPGADKCIIGYWTVDSGGGFTPGTDNTNGETANHVYHVRGAAGLINRVSDLPATDLVLDADATTFDVPALDVIALAQRMTQLAAQSNVAGDADGADLISTLKYGAWILVYQAGVATNDTYLLSAKGQEILDGASTQAYTTAALARAAAQTQIDQLPEMLVPIAIITVYNGTAGNWTIGTDKWDVALAVSAVEMLRPFQYHVTQTYGVVAATQAGAVLPSCPADEVAVAVLEIPASWTTADAITAAMCKEMDMVDYGQCYPTGG